MSQPTPGRDRQDEATHIVVPSVKELLDGVAMEAGLSTLDDNNLFRSGIRQHGIDYDRLRDMMSRPRVCACTRLQCER